MKSGKPVYCWDSSILIAWLQNEKREAGEMEAVTAIASENDDSKCIIAVSSIVRVEVLESKMPKKAGQTFIDFLDRQYVVDQNPNHAILNIAHNIRDYYQKDPKYQKTVTLPDAIHLATAIYLKADEFHTFDGHGKKDKGIGLLRLNGSVAGHSLKIVSPIKSQIDLFAGEAKGNAKKEEK